MRRICVLNALFATVAAAAIVAVVAPHASYAQSSKIIMADSFPPKANWAMETDDSFTLMRAGCLEGLARIDFDVKLQPSLADVMEADQPDGLGTSRSARASSFMTARSSMPPRSSSR